MSESIEEHRAKQRATAVDAFARGQAALASDDLPGALRWLDRAHRVAGGNDTIALLLSSVQFRLGRSAAAASFAALAGRHDLSEAWLGLAAARFQADEPHEAAAALGRLLSGHVLAVTPQLRALADAIVAATGAAGWCGLDTDHRLVSGGTLASPHLLLDQVPLRRWPGRLPCVGLLSVVAAGGHLLGSPLQLARMFRLDGFVEANVSGNLSGWAWHPNDPGTPPHLYLAGADAVRHLVVLSAPDILAEREADNHDRPLFQPHRFVIDAVDLPGIGPYRLTGHDARDVPGSPVDPLAVARYAGAAARAVAGTLPAASAIGALLHAPVPAGFVGRRTGARRRAALRTSIVIPAYRGLSATRACLDSVMAAAAPADRIIVVDDASPEPDLTAALERLAAAGRITLLTHLRNHGFPTAANTGIRAAGRDDVILLNADTVVPPDWVRRLRAIAYAAPDIGSVTPFSNDATLMSYPCQTGGNPIPDRTATLQLDRLAALAEAASPDIIELPTAIGFCMYVRRDCLDEVGLLRQDVFAQGYGEENDWCLRARHLGWRHVAAPGVFVGHIGGESFGPARTQLLARNLAVLNRLHPGYDALIAENTCGPALLTARRRLDRARLAARTPAGGSVILVTHDMGGGVQRQVDVRCAALRAAGTLPIVLRPVLARPILQGTGQCSVDLDPQLPNLIYDVATERAELIALLAAQHPIRIELHHMLGHDQTLADLPAWLGVPCDVHVHDYSWFCPRITLVGFERRYCGEPDIAGCIACIEDAGRATDDETPVPDLVRRSALTLGSAAQVIAPSVDTAARLQRHFPALTPRVEPWDDSRPAGRPFNPPQAGAPTTRTVGVLGAIGIEKGYDVLLACARDASARALPLRFVVIGHTTDDARLLRTGSVFITGEYDGEELDSLIAAESVDLAFLPSIWPETWCFTLSEAWRAGLHVAAFDIGAPAERIRRHGGGTLIPLACRAPQINATLLGWRQPV